MKSSFLTILLLTILFYSCNGKKEKQVELQHFSTVEVKEFKKKNVSISTDLKFQNLSEYEVEFIYAEFDIIVDGKDVGSFIQKSAKKIPANGLYSIPIQHDFKPEDAFLNLDYGLLKIKSDIVCPVRIVGYITILKNGKEDDIKFDVTQKVLFSNDNKLYLDADGNLQEK